MKLKLIEYIIINHTFYQMHLCSKKKILINFMLLRELRIEDILLITSGYQIQ